MAQQITQEQAKDIEKRAKSLNAELIPLLKKYQLDIGSVAFLLPDGRVGSRVQVIDNKFQKVEEKKEEIVEG